MTGNRSRHVPGTPISSVTFLHTSDLQLGMARAFLSAEAAPRFGQARIDAIATLGEHAREHGARFIVVAGDVFESNQISRQTLLRALDALRALPVPVFLLPGNHDPLDGTSLFSTPAFRDAGEQLVVLRDMTPVAVPGVDGVEVVGAPWLTRQPDEDLVGVLAASLAPAAGVLRIAVAHGQVDALAPDPSRPDIIDLAGAERAIAQDRFHYLALGDRHSVTSVGDSGRIWYSGAPVATAFDESDPNQALRVDIEAGGDCRVQPLPVGNWSFVDERHRLDGQQDLARFAAWLDALPDKERTAVKVRFEGSVDLATAAGLDELLERNAERFASLQRRDRPTRLTIVPSELDQDAVSLSGYAQKTWVALLEAARADDQVARDALRLFYRLSRQAQD